MNNTQKIASGDKSIIPSRNQGISFHQWRIREGHITYRSTVQQLSNTHLLAYLLRDQILAERLMERFGELNQIAEASTIELRQIFGIGIATAERIQAAFELSRRLNDSFPEEYPCIENPYEVYMLVRAEYQRQKQEILKALLLNTRNRVLKIETISVGTFNFSVIHPREIYRVALRHNAASIILIHNHPSGSPEPSFDDIQVTKQIAKGGKMVGIRLLDHIIIANEDYISLKEENLL